MIYSPHANIIRYTNGTLVKLIATSTGFISPDYDFAKDIGTYQPPSIQVTATFQGNVRMGTWELSKDGGKTFDGITSSDQGITIGDGYLTILPDSKLFSSGSIVVKCIGDDSEHYDTITITREVDPAIVYRRTFTDISQTNNKIMLIASDEQLAQFSSANTLTTKVADIELTADEFKTEVTSNYSTKTYVNESTSTAKTEAITTSQTYASAQAQTAEANAKTYASAQAQTAETNAKTYAGNVASTAESNAKTYAGNVASNAESNAKTYADGIGQTADNNAKQYANSAESNAKDYADSAANGAEQNAKDYTDGQLFYYPTTTTMQTTIDQTEQRILLTASKTYSTKEDLISATNGIYTLQANHRYQKDQSELTHAFEAKVLKNGENVTTQFKGSDFLWYLSTEDDPLGTAIAMGLTCTLKDSLVGYGGSIILNFHWDDTHSLEIYVPVYPKEALSKKFSSLEVKDDEISARVTEQYSTITGETENKLEDLETRMTLKADSIETRVTNKFGDYSTTAEMNGAIKTVDDRFDDYSTTTEMNGAIKNVDDKFANYSTTTEMQTAISQSATGIKSEVLKTVSEGYSTKTDYSTITQKVDGIESVVATNAQGKTIISSINQTSEDVTINAGKISLEGIVTANSYFKINQDGSMETIKATVGGININGSSIYSTGHDKVESTTPGFVLNSDGSFGFGDATNYIKFTKDKKDTWKAEANFDKLSISASDSLVIGGSTAATQSDISSIRTKAQEAKDTADTATSTANQAKTDASSATTAANEAKAAASSATASANEAKSTASSANTAASEAQATAATANSKATSANATANEAKSTATTANSTAEEAKGLATTASGQAEEAKKTATNFLFFDENTGLVVSEVGKSVPDDQKPHNVQIKGDGIYFRTKSTVLGKINGDGFTLYKPGAQLKKMMELISEGLYFYNTRSDDATAKYTDKGLEVISGKIADFTIVGNAITGSLSQESVVEGQTVTKTYSLAIRSPKNTGTRALELYGGESSPSFYLTYAGALFTNNATIGGMHVDASSIYSGSHKAYNSSNEGFYFGSSGAFSVGNGTSYIRFYKAGDDWKLDIRANELKFGGVAPATADDVASVRTIATGANNAASTAQTTADEAKSTASTASTNASSALTQVSSIRGDVTTANTTANQAKTAASTAQTTANTAQATADTATSTANQAKTAASTAQTTANEAKSTATTASTNASTALTTANTANTTANAAKTAATDAAKTATNYLYATTMGLYVSSNGANYLNSGYVRIHSEGIQICKGSNNIASWTGSGLNFYVNNTLRAQYGTSAIFYATNGSTPILTINDKGLTCYDSNNLGISIANGTFKIATQNGTSKFNVFQADANGVKIKSKSGSNVLTINEAGTVTFGQTIYGTYASLTGSVSASSGSFSSGITVSSGLTIYASISSAGVGSFRGITITDTSGVTKGQITTAGVGSFASNVSVGGNLSVTGTASLSKTLTVTGKVTMSGGASVTSTKNTLSDPGFLCYQNDGLTIGWKKLGSSSRRYKDVHRNLSKEDVEAFYSVRPVLAEYKKGHFSEDDPWNGVSMPMMIAEDIEEAFPGCTHKDEEGLPRDYDNHVMLSVHQQMILDQRERINALESEVAELKEMIRRLLDGKTN